MSHKPRYALTALLSAGLLAAGLVNAAGAAPAGRSTAAGQAWSVMARDSLRAALTKERFYFLMPDRFANGTTSNDRGGLTGPREVTGFDPTRKGWYHGGDLKGMISKLDYIKGLGTTAIWLTPSFKNKPVQGLGTPYPSAAYHGYWITDFTQVDPHLGTNQELEKLIAGAHARHMKVFFDIITNHTADVITYTQKPGGPAPFDYVSKAAVPYRNANGTVFDDRAYAGTNAFPPLSADVSFPFRPVLPAGDEKVKVPNWLNDVTLYHNRGNTTFSGENSTYGDFFGLDDLFTENPRVVHGMEGIYDYWIRNFGIDGFRIDTMKHVNIEFWQKFLPHIRATARSVGKPDFFAFGEVAEGVSVPFLSRFTTTGRAQAVLDFPYQQQAREFAASHPTDQLRTLFEQDDWYTDANSNAYELPTFLGNHDMGHIGMFLRDDNPGNSEAQLLQRDKLAHELLYLTRGNPVVYFGDEQGFTGAGNDQAARQDMFASKDSEYNNLDDDGIDPLNGQNLSDAGKNDNIGSDVTPAANNFDRSHPLYRTIAALANLRKHNRALADGAQQIRYSSSTPGIFAFSRTDAKQQIEYVVALNNSTAPATADIPTYSAGMAFKNVWGGAVASVTTSADKKLSLTVPAMSAVVYRATHRMQRSAAAPTMTLSAPAQASGRIQVQANLAGDSLYQVSFYMKNYGGHWTPLGTDDNAPYRVYPDVSGFKPGTALQLLAVAKDNAGHISTARTETTVVAPSGAGAGIATIHYHRADNNYADWGLHLFGDAIGEGVGTSWDKPRPPTRFDAFGAVFEIPLADAAASLNFIIHKPSGDSVPTTREPGGDRAFVPDLSREVWMISGDPTIHTSKP
ncbi:alpha-amylase family glycosyl hydrolase [Jatrophihabitans sp.]|jgi:glycosidase|uniref:alpha-amylase family glycosyl hydrolase n=1 Tax=Jatrophihabitans sp. TaxID=1932789 RepID=UPI002F124967